MQKALRSIVASENPEELSHFDEGKFDLLNGLSVFVKEFYDLLINPGDHLQLIITKPEKTPPPPEVEPPPVDIKYTIRYYRKTPLGTPDFSHQETTKKPVSTVQKLPLTNKSYSVTV